MDTVAASTLTSSAGPLDSSPLLDKGIWQARRQIIDSTDLMSCSWGIGGSESSSQKFHRGGVLFWTFTMITLLTHNPHFRFVYGGSKTAIFIVEA